MKRELAALVAREHDVLVIGGGIHGAAAAWEAAQRGLGVALLEARDFGSGTSWNSLKTIHGGLRHLQRADLAGLRESCRERNALLRIAPGLVRPLRFLVPAYGHGLRGREALALGLLASDLLSLDRNRGLAPASRIPRGRTLSRAEVLALLPGIDARGLRGAALWTDAQVTSSERLTLGLLHAAAGAGAALANYAEVRKVSRQGAHVAGVTAVDLETGAELELRARFVLNAAGPALDRVLALAGVGRPPLPLLDAINLVLRRPVVTDHAVAAWSGGRFLFLVPWEGRALVGTSYAPAGSGLPDPGAFLAEARRAYPWAGLEREDVAVVHRGQVPGTGGPRGLWTRSRVVDHQAEDGIAGIASLLGVKYTTARALAERAVDLVLRRLGRPPAPSLSSETPLPWARPLEGSTEQRTRHAVRDEMALHAADVVLRRIDLGTGGRPQPRDLEAVLGAMASELHWSEARARSERQDLEAALAELELSIAP
jgi:glycerol-3-phosphate dehydrogenase